jgi:hypothetical protein
MKAFATIIVLAAASLVILSTKGAAADRMANIGPAVEAGQAADTSARRKLKRHRYVYRSYRGAYGYAPGYYRGVRPGWGYGPDPGDYAWPPFHFKPYW